MDRECSDCKTCITGEYIKLDCVGGTNTDTKLCESCKSCNPGYYMYAPCNGGGFLDTPSCALCDTCAPLNGMPQYISQECSGVGISRGDRVCSICTCPIGQYMYSICFGGIANQICLVDNSYVAPTTTPAIETTAREVTTPSPLLLVTTPSPSEVTNTDSGGGINVVVIIASVLGGVLVIILALTCYSQRSKFFPENVSIDKPGDEENEDDEYIIYTPVFNTERFCMTHYD
jgi:hypothetical protein